MANIITGIRIVLSVLLLFFPAFSPAFFVLYIAAGASDMIDGAVARKTGTVSEFGSRLDTAADIVFAAVCLIKLLPVPDKTASGIGYPALALYLDRRHRIHKGGEYRSRIHPTERVHIGAFRDEQGYRRAALRFPADAGVHGSEVQRRGRLRACDRSGDSGRVSDRSEGDAFSEAVFSPCGAYFDTVTRFEPAAAAAVNAAQAALRPMIELQEAASSDMQSE